MRADRTDTVIDDQAEQADWTEPMLRAQMESGRDLTRRWTIMTVGAWTGQLAIVLAYGVGSFVLALLAARGPDPTVALAGLFLLGGICGTGWLVAKLGQELADSVQTLHCDILQAVGHSLSQDSPEIRRGTGLQYLGMARGFGDARRLGTQTTPAWSSALYYGRCFWWSHP